MTVFPYFCCRKEGINRTMLENPFIAQSKRLFKA